MKSLGEIVRDVRIGKKPEYDELRYAIVALHALSSFDRMAFMDLFRGELERREGKPTNGIKFQTIYSPEWQANERIGRQTRAYEKSPKEYVGDSYDPDNPDVVKRIVAAEVLVDIILADTSEVKP